MLLPFGVGETTVPWSPHEWHIVVALIRSSVPTQCLAWYIFDQNTAWYGRSGGRIRVKQREQFGTRLPGRFGDDWESAVVPLKLALTKACLCDYLQEDYHFEYTECDSSGSRWRVAIPDSAVDCSGLPDPVRGKECSTFWLSDHLFSWLNRKPFIWARGVTCSAYKRPLKKGTLI